ncbi:HK97 family phage prohead protease [Pedobacter cryoconitis]|uniref:HK97 family phage prohead protease n=1 Tax=Pedobacter cryoconitis TaxID=188932 RepID=A0A327SID0_9SPHI|nr:HK97 family phage prohead protease [Pedobacter cryoconitis]RAJ28876.1 HK97 family phage prohead protease [Pedobacter cryoconitis]
METKKLSTEVKEVDDTLGYVEAYANAYGNEDSDKDISHQDSFVKTVKEDFKRIRVYKNHNQTILVGVPKLLDPKDPYGLKTGTQFNMNTDDGKNMFWDVKLIHDNNQNADLSIGYRVMERDQKDRRIITEYKLKEYSFLTSWGANDRAIATSIKNAKDPQEFIAFLVKAYNLPYSDARLIALEDILKTLSNNETPEIKTAEHKSIYELINTNF